MDARQKVWVWVSAAVLLVVGLILVLRDSAAAGGFLVVLAIADLATLTSQGQAWAKINPGLVRWGLIAVALLAALLIIIVAIVLWR